MTSSALARLFRGLLAATLLISGGAVMGNAGGTAQPLRVVLVGASIGKAWHIEKIRDRVALPGYEFDYAGAYEFDKGPLIRKLVAGLNKPDVVMIKECGTYFPGDFASYQRQVASWTGTLRAAGIRPVLVTTAPVARPKDYVSRAKFIIKRLIGKPTTYDSIAQFNDWLKQYARQEGIPVFDLEAALRLSDKERWLRNEYDVGDNLHLNETAYRAIDGSFVEFLTDWKRESW